MENHDREGGGLERGYRKFPWRKAILAGAAIVILSFLAMPPTLNRPKNSTDPPPFPGREEVFDSDKPLPFAELPRLAEHQLSATWLILEDFLLAIFPIEGHANEFVVDFRTAFHSPFSTQDLVRGHFDGRALVLERPIDVLRGRRRGPYDKPYDRLVPLGWPGYRTAWLVPEHLVESGRIRFETAELLEGDTVIFIAVFERRGETPGRRGGMPFTSMEPTPIDELVGAWQTSDGTGLRFEQSDDPEWPLLIEFDTPMDKRPSENGRDLPPSVSRHAYYLDGSLVLDKPVEGVLNMHLPELLSDGSQPTVTTFRVLHAVGSFHRWLIPDPLFRHGRVLGEVSNGKLVDDFGRELHDVVYSTRSYRAYRSSRN